jgi:membrane associated rhomboid family serine protease
MNDFTISKASVRLLSVTLSLFEIFIFTSPFLRVLAVHISARWMVLCFTGKQVNTSYSSEQMLVMLFLCNNLWKKDNVYKDGDPREI